MTNRYFVLIFTTLFVITLLISFFLKINLSNILGTFAYNSYLLNYDIQTKTGGVVSDLVTHWNYLSFFKKRPFNNYFFSNNG